ncbi:ABC-2 type transport system permease protein [Actinomadura pelletieri DSM 43383]|uniref:ABC-2 type transport system permease protein n=1 Tax=Actinomadura pelletieri DSM 43383 TaxID=1120940 RepID=A0A495QXF6_9ACTN|nr:ABC transporter permease subunit [Actinomadura pelletieri]RKS78800.1 ABC-2 type transport system permease protein [Actinomadura pelletieri DSM 43383]
MTRTMPVRTAAGPRPVGRLRVGAGVAWMTVRLIRRGVAWLALALACYVVVEVVTYERTYPDLAAREKLAALSQDPAVRILQGMPHAPETTGGYVVWDAGWMLAAIVGLWALLTTGRLLRGEEEAGRSELVLVAPIRPARVVLVQCGVIGGAALVAGASVAVPLMLLGTGVAGSALLGIGLAGFAATFAAVAAVLAQLFQVRRRATTVSVAVFGALFVLRMAANSADSRGWLRWFTPFGWLDDLHPYRDPNWAVLTVTLTVPAVLAGIAVALRTGRDNAGALIGEPDHARTRLRLLGGPTAFAWRGTRGMLAGWLLGIAGYAFVAGTLIATIIDYAADDPDYQRVLESLGWDAGDVADGFVAIMGGLIGLMIALFASWRIGAARAEEAAGRLDHVLTRPVTRHRWLAGHVLLTLVSAVVLALGAAVAMWAGAAATDAGMGMTDMLAATLNPLPVAALATGLAVVLFGAWPRLTVPASAAAAVTTYLIEMIGPALDWPEPVLAVSPFHHLADVPAEPFALTTALVMTVSALVLAAAGVLLFERRDLAGD